MNSFSNRKIIDTTQDFSDPALNVLIDRIRSTAQDLTLSGMTGSAGALVLSLLQTRVKKTLLCVCPTITEAKARFRDFSFFLGEANVILFPPWDILSADVLASQGSVRANRLEGLSRVLLETPAVVIAPLEAALQKVVPVGVFGEYLRTISLGDILERDAFLATLIEGGYKGVSLVEEKGEFSVRGHILDIFPLTRAMPVRMEFIGDEVESIREFDPVTQRSRQEVIDFVLSPASELIFSQDIKTRTLKNIRIRANDLEMSRAKREHLIEMVEENLVTSVNPHLLSVFYGQYNGYDASDSTDGLDTLFDYVSAGSLVVIDDMLALKRAEAEIENGVDQFIVKARADGKFYLEKEFFSLSLDALMEHGRGYRKIFIETLVLDTARDETKSEVSFTVRSTTGLRHETGTFLKKENGLLTPLTTRIKAWLEEGQLVVFLCAAEETARMKHLLGGYALTVHEAEDPLLSEISAPRRTGRLVICAGSLTEGFVYPALKLVMTSQEEVFGKKIKRKRKTYAREGFFLKSFSELREGNYVVHGEHGIGIYHGLQKLSFGDIENDFLLIEYQGGDKLYIPVDHLDIIQRYIGPEDHIPGMDRLGSSHWESVKKRVKKSVRAIAKELIKLYAAREVMSGHQFPEPDRYYEEFASSFKYEETPDQARAIDDVNHDLSDVRPMDRLICGDAGFGKTEVAVRAAFRVAMEGKQVAMLVPTTILAEQHYRTFAERLERYPVRIEVLNRFKTKAEQAKIVDDINKGLVDIVVGTQRILQKDVAFTSLGLVVIDEEQRFGVNDKEKLKKLRTLVDVLTLSATPIPRTLQLSLVGIRDLSVIETPPEDRQAITLHVNEFDREIVRHAITHELARGGQVFFIHDRVKSINSMARFVETLVPEAKIGVAHGQMKSRDLEAVMVKFLRKEYNTLLCTTIIGSGVDIPSVNTIIINRADRFGLAQLYQLRGRVGRSNEEGYAYLLVPSGVMLSRDAQKRLRVIQDFSEPGAGFKVATHDLEIRGGGNLLGMSQSGHISAVGYELYTELMEKTIGELRGERGAEKEIRPEINFGLPAFIPDDYIEDVQRRLMAYKKISLAASDDDLVGLQEELVDCYGALPPEVGNLMAVIGIRNQLKAMMIRKMEYNGAHMFVAFHEDSSVEPQKIVDLARSNVIPGMRFSPDLTLHVPIPGLVGDAIVTQAKDLLDRLKN